MSQSIILNRAWSDYKKHWSMTLVFAILALPFCSGFFFFPILVVLIGYVPCIFYKTQKVVTPKDIGSFLGDNFLRIIIAGICQTIAIAIGTLLCFIPGILVSLSTPLVLSRIVNTDKSGFECVKLGIQEVFTGLGSKKILLFIMNQFIIGLVLTLSITCTFGLGGIVALPVAQFYLYGYMKNNNLGNDAINLLPSL